MNKPNFPFFKIIGNIIGGLIGGLILGFFIGLGLNLIGIFSDNKFDYNNIFIITGLIIFSILTYLTISTYNEELENYNSKVSEELEEKNRRENRNKNSDENKRKYLELINDIKIKFANSENKVSLLENDFQKLLTRKENELIEIDKKENKNYVHQFIKVSNYINKKRNHIQQIFEDMTNVNNVQKVQISGKIKDFERPKDPEKELNDLPNKIDQLEKSIILYEQVIIHGINMISSLLNNKLFTFYQIYEFFDGIGIYENNWQNKMTEKLDEINNTLKIIDKHLEEGLDNLTYCFENSFIELGDSISKELQNINSNLQFNNLMTTIQTRKLYQIRKDTKQLN